MYEEKLHAKKLDAALGLEPVKSTNLNLDMAVEVGTLNSLWFENRGIPRAIG